MEKLQAAAERVFQRKSPSKVTIQRQASLGVELLKNAKKREVIDEVGKLLVVEMEEPYAPRRGSNSELPEKPQSWLISPAFRPSCGQARCLQGPHHDDAYGVARRPLLRPRL